jgi:hypothetical protein
MLIRAEAYPSFSWHFIAIRNIRLPGWSITGYLPMYTPGSREQVGLGVAYSLERRLFFGMARPPSRGKLQKSLNNSHTVPGTGQNPLFAKSSHHLRKNSHTLDAWPCKITGWATVLFPDWSIICPYWSWGRMSFVRYSCDVADAILIGSPSSTETPECLPDIHEGPPNLAESNGAHLGKEQTSLAMSFCC